MFEDEGKVVNGQERHEMRLEATHPTGAEEWYCPTCGRRFLMQWPPEYKRIILQPGDESAMHSGGKGGIRIGSLDVTSGESNTSMDEKLDAWIEGLGEVDLNV